MATLNTTNLDRLIRRLPSAMDGAAKSAAEAMAEAAKARIRSGSKTGRLYGNHQASAPGESPANKSGRLANSISVRRRGPGDYDVIAAEGYAAILELKRRPIFEGLLEKAAEAMTQELSQVLEEAQ